jgi:hypothetical protein
MSKLFKKKVNNFIVSPKFIFILISVNIIMFFILILEVYVQSNDMDDVKDYLDIMSHCLMIRSEI